MPVDGGLSDCPLDIRIYFSFFSPVFIFATRIWLWARHNYIAIVRHKPRTNQLHVIQSSRAEIVRWVGEQRILNTTCTGIGLAFVNGNLFCNFGENRTDKGTKSNNKNCVAVTL